MFKFKLSVKTAVAGAFVLAGATWALFGCLNSVDIDEAALGEKSEVIFHLPAGTAAGAIPKILAEHGVDVNGLFFKASLRLQDAHRSLHAGYYKVFPTDTVLSLTQRLTKGESVLFPWRLADGSTYWEMRKSLNAIEGIKHDTVDMTPEALLFAIGAEENHLEGLFAPETYNFRAGVSDLRVLKMAYEHQRAILKEEWLRRSDDCAVKTPYEALILASIIEREVARSEDRYIVSGIFTNRLRIGMRLQTDPTVIYGEGEAFEGRLRRQHLDRTTPYNTYRFAGLPPTPIGNPTRESIRAALNPAKCDYYYFINKDNGDLVPSRTLEEHNKAVNRYIRKIGQ